ncbi:hypothetical protein GIB67_016415 [Kingdonia uniflora]|uniref:DUF4283 domain-containing protein n=1 Tax=Kingdonia uniflora TaxID=39325 RepID=A0A7J7MGY3_9MAGN|nr:hypothetical protein GIB67_016415 [Kingdonia uniflora]
MKIKSTDFSSKDSEYEDVLVGHFVCVCVCVCVFVGGRVAYSILKDYLIKVWEVKGEIKLTLHGLGYYFISFTNPEDRIKALETGHFHVASRLFFIRNWRPFIKYEPKETQTLPLWVMFYNIPAQCWNREGLGKVASLIGKPLYTDKMTKKQKRPYARICIKVNAMDKLPKQVSIVVDDKYTIILSVEYNWFPPTCQSCQVFGHNPYTCPINPKTDTRPQPKVFEERDSPPGQGQSSLHNQKVTTKDKPAANEDHNIATNDNTKKGSDKDISESSNKGEQSNTVTNSKGEERKGTQGQLGEDFQLSKSVIRRQKKKINKEEKDRRFEEAL